MVSRGGTGGTGDAANGSENTGTNCGADAQCNCRCQAQSTDQVLLAAGDNGCLCVFRHSALSFQK